MAESFRAAFPEIDKKEDDAFWDAVRVKMEDAPSLLVLDQAGDAVDFSELFGWRCDLLVTDRRAELPGFSVLSLEPLDRDASERLLRLSAGLPLEKQPVNVSVDADLNGLLTAMKNRDDLVANAAVQQLLSNLHNAILRTR